MEVHKIQLAAVVKPCRKNHEYVIKPESEKPLAFDNKKSYKMNNLDSDRYKDATTYKIGEVARQANVNKETVRYYEKRKLIPKPDRRRSGYRIFTQRHVDQIKFIKRAKGLGFTLSEIKELLELRLDENTSCSEIKTEAQEKYLEVNRKIENLNRIKETLSNLIDSCSGEGPKGDCPILLSLESPARAEHH